MTEKTRKFPVYTVIRWVGTLSAIALLVYLLQKQGWEQIVDAVVEHLEYDVEHCGFEDYNIDAYIHRDDKQKLINSLNMIFEK